MAKAPSKSKSDAAPEAPKPIEKNEARTLEIILAKAKRGETLEGAERTFLHKAGFKKDGTPRSKPEAQDVNAPNAMKLLGVVDFMGVAALQNALDKAADRGEFIRVLRKVARIASKRKHKDAEAIAAFVTQAAPSQRGKAFRERAGGALKQSKSDRVVLLVRQLGGKVGSRIDQRDDVINGVKCIVLSLAVEAPAAPAAPAASEDVPAFMRDG